MAITYGTTIEFSRVVNILLLSCKVVLLNYIKLFFIIFSQIFCPKKCTLKMLKADEIS